jgi:hypothetical protein
MKSLPSAVTPSLSNVLSEGHEQSIAGDHGGLESELDRPVHQHACELQLRSQILVKHLPGLLLRGEGC